MMYVIKINDYYVKSVDMLKNINNTYLIDNITLSQRTMRKFQEYEAKVIAKEINAEIIKIKDEVSCELI